MPIQTKILVLFLQESRLVRNRFLQKLHYGMLHLVHLVSRSVLLCLMQGPNQVCGYVSQWQLGPYEAYLQQFVCCKWRAFQLLAFAVEDHLHLRRCCLWLVSHTRLLPCFFLPRSIALCKSYLLSDEQKDCAHGFYNSDEPCTFVRVIFHLIHLVWTADI